MKNLKLTHLSPTDLERRSRWRKQQLWQGQLIRLYGIKEAKRIIRSERTKK